MVFSMEMETIPMPILTGHISQDVLRPAISVLQADSLHMPQSIGLIGQILLPLGSEMFHTNSLIVFGQIGFRHEVVTIMPPCICETTNG